MKTRNFQLVRQHEQAECGLACIAMICGYYGYETTLAALRADYPTGGRGMNLQNLSDVLMKLDFRSKSLKVELEHISRLDLPCILHWRMNHFVVLTDVKKPPPRRSAAHWIRNTAFYTDLTGQWSLAFWRLSPRQKT